VDINATHHRSVSDGMVTAVATAISRGRRVACYEIVISDEAQRRVCTARITCQLVPAGAGDPTAPPAGGAATGG
jgi:1,4-dihydroxy-2-naphthoyl-CoA hydrolase